MHFMLSASLSSSNAAMPVTLKCNSQKPLRLNFDRTNARFSFLSRIALICSAVLNFHHLSLRFPTVHFVLDLATRIGRAVTALSPHRGR